MCIKLPWLRDWLVLFAAVFSIALTAPAQDRNHLNNARPTDITADANASYAMFAANGPNPGDGGPGGVELWYSDGIPGVGITKQVQDLEPGPTSSFPANITFVSPSLAFFTARTTTTGRELWRVNPNPTSHVASMVTPEIVMGAVGSDPADLTVVGTRVFFTARDQPGLRRLYYIDGTPVSAPATVPSAVTYDAPDELTWVPGTSKLVFTARSTGRLAELCVTDTNTLATSVIPTTPGGSSPLELSVWGTRVYFIATGRTGGREIWVTDGTSAASIFGSTSSGLEPNQLTPGGRYLAFTGRDLTLGRQLYQVDTAGVLRRPASNLARGYTISSLTAGHALSVETFWFTVDDPVRGVELWRTDASGAAIPVTNIAPGAQSSNPINLTPLPASGLLLFRANDGTTGHELWVSDGTTTFPHSDIKQGAASSYPGPMRRLANDLVLFSAEDGNGIELRAAVWNAPSFQVYEIEQAPLGSQPQLVIEPGLNAGMGFLTFRITDAPPMQRLSVFVSGQPPNYTVGVNKKDYPGRFPNSLRGVLMFGLPAVQLPGVATNLAGEWTSTLPFVVPGTISEPLLWQAIVATGRDAEPLEVTNNNTCGSGNSVRTQGGGQVRHSSCADDDTGEYHAIVERIDSGNATKYVALLRVKVGPPEELRLLETDEAATSVHAIEAGARIELRGFMDLYTPVDGTDASTMADKLEIRLYDDPPGPDPASLQGGVRIWRSYC